MLPASTTTQILRLYVTGRIVEYPFVLRNLELPLGSTVLDLGAAGSPPRITRGQLILSILLSLLCPRRVTSFSSSLGCTSENKHPHGVGSQLNI